MTSIRVCHVLIGACLICVPSASAQADLVAKTFAGVAAAATHGFVDLEQSPGAAEIIAGLGLGWSGGRLNLEGEFATAPGFFRGDGDLLEKSGLVSVMANVSWQLRQPSARMRPYVGGGIGLVHVSIDDRLHAFTSNRSVGALQLGGGILWTLTPRLAWVGDVRYLRTQYGGQNTAAFGEEFVAFTRIVTGLALHIR